MQVDPNRLEALGVTIDEVSSALDAANYSAPGGTIRRGRYRYALRALGEFQTVAEIGETVVGRGAGGRLVLLRDVARVEDGFADRETIARYNGRESVGLLVYKESGANTVQVAERVDEVLELLRQEYPEVEIAIASSQAGFIRDAISNVVQALALGAVLAFLVLFLFLHDARYPVAISLSIPISVILTFGLLYLFDVSLNIMSLGGLALGVGMLVDNSIVVLENIFRHRERGLKPDRGGGRGRPGGAGGDHGVDVHDDRGVRADHLREGRGGRAVQGPVDRGGGLAARLVVGSPDAAAHDRGADP